MGQVFRAQDTRLRRDVAIKILHSGATGDEGARRRLLREARAAAALSHPSIVTVYSVEEVADRCFIVMELVDGLTLADRLAAGALDLSEVCDIGAQVADALAAAHASGIVHHDVTPRNILLSGGRAKLADFGLSRPVEQQSTSLESTRTGPQIAGTVYYMSPEQARGESCTSRSDLFSLGSVLYHAATERRPFEGGNHFAVLDAITRIKPPQPSAIRTGVPPAFDTLLGRLLEKRAEDRTIDAQQAAGVLRSLGASLSAGGRPLADASRDTPHERTPFVGRARELSQLSAALSRAAAGGGSTVAITGDAGMGKTALVEALLQARDTLAVNALVCRGQSVEYSGAGEAYMPVIDALAPMVAHPGHGLHEVVRNYAPSWRSQFPGVYRPDETASTPPIPARLARELGDALSAAARSRPVVMVLEDLHWADPSTAELLRHLAHRATRIALLILVTLRAEEAAAAGSPFNQILAELEARGICDTIELTRLDEAGVREYLDRRFSLGESLMPLASLLSKATEGQPLFLTSLVQLFIQRGDVQHVGEAWSLITPIDRLHLGIPRTVQAVIRRKLAALEQTDRGLLQHASIEGHEFSTAVLSALVDIDPTTLEERLNGITKASGIVTALGPERYADGTWGARYQFAHAVYHNVVYDDLTPSRRADLHRQVAKRLEGLHSGRTAAIAAQLARHFKDGREAARAFEYYVQAGDNSMTLSAGLEADGHYSQAIELARTDGIQIEPGRIALARHKRAMTRAFLGDPLAALTDYREALIAASEVGDRDLMFDIQVNIVYAHVFAERPDEAIKAAADVEQSAEPPPGGVKRLRYLNLDLQLKIGCGDLDQAPRVGDDAVALAQSLGDSGRLLASLGVRAQIHYYRAEYASALSHLRQISSVGAAGTRRLVDPRPLNIHFFGTLFLGLTLGDLGHISEALTTLNSGLEIARSDGYSFWVPRLLNAINGLYGEIGALDAAMRHAEDALTEAADQNIETRTEVRLNLATACLRLGQLDRAASLVAEAGGLNRQNTWYAWLCRIHYDAIAAEEALSRGAQAAAADLAREGAALARRYGVWKYAVIAERLQAEAAAADDDWSRAGAHIQQAIDILTEHPVPILGWKVHATAARINRHRGLDAEAAAALEQARDQARQLSDRIQEEPLRATFLNYCRHFVGESNEAGATR
jgi:type II secretory pathway predicted ATPase ExeA/tetratricopeptide (TPR) repeat protein